MGYITKSFIYKNHIRGYLRYWYNRVFSYKVAEAFDNLSYIHKDLVELDIKRSIIFKDYNNSTSEFSWQRPYAEGNNLLNFWACLNSLNLGETIEYNITKNNIVGSLKYFYFNEEQITIFLSNYNASPTKIQIN